MAEPTVLTPDMLEGCFIHSVQIIPGQPMVVMELEDRQEKKVTLTLIAGAVPMLNGNFMVVNPSITLNLTKKELISEKV